MVSGSLGYSIGKPKTKWIAKSLLKSLPSTSIINIERSFTKLNLPIKAFEVILKKLNGQDDLDVCHYNETEYQSIPKITTDEIIKERYVEIKLCVKFNLFPYHMYNDKASN